MAVSCFARVSQQKFLIAPLLLRNYLPFGQPFFHTLPGDHFLHLVGAPIIQQVTHCSHQEALSNIDQQADKIIQQQKIFVKRPLNAI